jgi:hypothetical protein
MRMGPALVRHTDWRDTPADLTGQTPVLSGEHHMLMHPNSRPTHCAPIRDALDDGFDPPGVARPPVSSRPASSGTGTP